MTEVHIPNAVVNTLTQSDWLGIKRFADVHAMAFEREVAVLIDLTHVAVWRVFDRWQSFKEGARAFLEKRKPVFRGL